MEHQNRMTAHLLTVPYRVPYYAQIATPWLATAFFERRLIPALDPHWEESGAYSLEEYLYWVNRACGAACVKMAVEALGGERLPLIEWARRGVRLGGYLTEKRPDGSQSERGWLHSALAELIRGAGFSAEARPLAIREFVSELSEGGMIIASVSHEIGTHGPITKRGGHLVLVFGAVLEKNEPIGLLLHNPSGRSDALRVNAQIPVERFAAAYTGRGITVHQI
jgi:hypothetical protein